VWDVRYVEKGLWVESLGRSTHATILREILQPDCLQETDGETEFENYPCEGDRALSTRLSYRRS